MPHGKQFLLMVVVIVSLFGAVPAKRAPKKAVGRKCNGEDILQTFNKDGDYIGSAVPHDCTALNLWMQVFDGSSISAIVDALHANAPLEELGLNKNNLDDRSAILIAEALKGNTALKALYISWNKIGDRGAAAIADALKVNTALTRLNMHSHVAVNSDITASIKASLEENQDPIKRAIKQRSLVTEFNSRPRGGMGNSKRHRMCKEDDILETFSNDGDFLFANLPRDCTTLSLESGTLEVSTITAVVQALHANAALVELGMSKIHIGDSSATLIAEAIQYNSVLKRLDLGGNNIGDRGAAAIAEALKFNVHLMTLQLRNNNVQDSAITASIKASLAENKDPVQRTIKIHALERRRQAGIVTKQRRKKYL